MMRDRRPRPDSHVRGYALVTLSYVIFGAIGALVNYASAPESMLLVLRFGTSALVLSILFARRRTIAEFRMPGIGRQMLLMGLLDAVSQLCFFVALRETGVAVGMFLFYTGPVFVALLAPRFERQTTDRAVWPALGLALAGLAVILVPRMAGSNVHLTPLGVACGVAAAILWALFMLVMKSLTRSVSAAAIVIAECWLDALFLLPLALWQTIGSGYSLTSHDLVSGALLGLVCTAFAYMIFVRGVRHIRVQHASILGYLEPVSAPLYALALLGERPTAWTLGGGALILSAGILVAVFGRPEEEALAV